MVVLTTFRWDLRSEHQIDDWCCEVMKKAVRGNGVIMGCMPYEGTPGLWKLGVSSGGDFHPFEVCPWCGSEIHSKSKGVKVSEVGADGPKS